MPQPLVQVYLHIVFSTKNRTTLGNKKTTVTITPKVLHTSAQGRAAHPGNRKQKTNTYAEGVIQRAQRYNAFGVQRTLVCCSQGALRDPGLSCSTPSA